MVQWLRFLLFPFSWMYALVMLVRNKMYQLSILKSYEIPIPSIVVGNLSTGGTGKTPHVEFILEAFKTKYKIAVLSRGYGRKTKGFIKANPSHRATDIGDEPLQLFLKFGQEVDVYVSENRALGVQQLLKIEPKTQLIVLDDAFQHRQVKAGLYLLLSKYKKPFFKDFVLPVGNLREPRIGKKRADICIFTKCPSKLSTEKKLNLSRKFKRFTPQYVYFSNVKNGDFKALTNNTPSKIENILLVSGIADAQAVQDALSANYRLKQVSFSDHHHFNAHDITKIHKIFDNFASNASIILCTEKDMVRLKNNELWDLIQDKPWYYLPMSVKIDREEELKQTLEEYVKKAGRNH